MATWSIRRYAGTLRDARGLLAVERETFGECPYNAEELAGQLARPEQRVWLGEAGGEIVGFAAGLRTCGLRGPQLEADLLAVHPAWQRRGLATALLTTLRRDGGDVDSLRGVVNSHNPASSGAFARAGFQPSEAMCDLLLYRIRGYAPRPAPAWGGVVHTLQSAEEAERAAALDPASLPSGPAIWSASQRPGVTVLVAETGGTLAGVAELLEVHTALYSGLWLESLHASGDRQRTLGGLIAAAVELAKRQQLDEVGCMAPQSRWALRMALLEEGFAPLDSYQTWTAAPLCAEVLRP